MVKIRDTFYSINASSGWCATNPCVIIERRSENLASKIALTVHDHCTNGAIAVERLIAESEKRSSQNLINRIEERKSDWNQSIFHHLSRPMEYQ